jgi:surface-anchored protein
MRILTPLNPLGNRLVRQDRGPRRAHPARPRLAVELLENRLVLDRTILDMVHAHIEVNYTNGAWSMDVLDETNNVVYAPSDVLLYVNATARQTQPAGWNFIGAGDGNMDWQLPEEEVPTLTTIALSTENTAPGTFNIYRPNDPRISRTGEWMKFALRDLHGPGDISAWQDDQQPPLPSSWWISSFDGGRTLDPLVYIEPGGHMHLNWGFTAVGVYQVTFEASAFINGHGLPTRSDAVTFYFGVEDTGQPPVPPPSGAGPWFSWRALNTGMAAPVSPSDALAPRPIGIKPAAEATLSLTGERVAQFFASATTAELGVASPTSRRHDAHAKAASLPGEVLGNELQFVIRAY